MCFYRFSAHSLDKDKMSQITTKTQNQEHSKSNYFIYRIMNFKKKVCTSNEN